MRQALVKGDEVGDVDIAVVLLGEDMLSDLISVITSAIHDYQCAHLSFQPTGR